MVVDDAAAPETARDRLLKLHEELCKEARAIMRKKNTSYAESDEVFKNFCLFGRKHAARGILFRLGDKLSRLSVIVDKGKLEGDDGESVKDACLDGLNYFLLLYAFLKEEGLV